MRKIRAEMWAVTYKGKIFKGSNGTYTLFSTRKAAQEFTRDTTAGVVKVTVTIQPKE